MSSSPLFLVASCLACHVVGPVREGRYTCPRCGRSFAVSVEEVPKGS